MNRLMLLGNGFDLAHGLKTKYSDFIFEYFKSCLIKSQKKFSYEDPLIKITYNGRHSNDFTTLDGLTSIFPFVKKQSDLYNPLTFRPITPDNSICYITLNNEYLEHLLLSCFEDDWYDIERLYFENLIKIFQIKDPEEKKKKLNEFHSGFIYLIHELKTYISSLDYHKVFVDHSYLDIFKQESDLMKILDLNENELKEIRKNNKERLSENGTLISPRITHILSFNYSNTAWLYNREIGVQSELNYIHGTADKEIIFGFGDERNKLYQELEDLDNNEFLKFTKSFQYSFENDYHNLIRFADSDIFEVFVLGHSCGLSDRTMLNTIFEHNNCRAIRVFFHRKQDGTDNFMETVQNISRHFKNKSSMRKRVLPKNEYDIMPQVASRHRA